MTIVKSITYSLAALIAMTAFAQLGVAQEEATTATKEVATAVEKVAKTTEIKKVKVMLDKEGQLNGNVFLKLEDEQKPVNAKVTLSHDGVVVDSVEAKEDGSFAFPSLEPGSYQMFGTSDSYVGGQSFDVMPYSGGSGCASCDLGLSGGSNISYDSYAAAPCQSLSASPCGTCGGGLGSRLGGRLGGGGGFGGGGLGGGGGGLLSRPLLLGGAIGGIIAIASDDDNSPDQ